MTPPSYSVVSPVRDEAEHLPRTAASLVSQSHRPLEWVIVDDGSTDGTREIAERWAAQYSWISVISGESRHRRARGAPIVAAFKRGLAQLRERPDVVVKLDGDLFLPGHYFRWVAAVFERDPRSGIVGGALAS
jgi:poly-beta-1,6-N-acetyl-D-glucosamine synthase